MASGALRVAGSLVGLALLSAVGAVLLSSPGLDDAPAEAAAALGRRAGFHGASLPAAVPGEAGTCRGCHGASPHGRARARAFLNLHAARMDCGVCHLARAGDTYRRLGGPQGLVAAGRPAGDGWEPRAEPAAGEAVRRQGPRCGECHRAGSAVLSGGLYDAWQRRVLEELALLYRLGGAGL